MVVVQTCCQGKMSYCREISKLCQNCHMYTIDNVILLSVRFHGMKMDKEYSLTICS